MLYVVGWAFTHDVSVGDNTWKQYAYKQALVFSYQEIVPSCLLPICDYSYTCCFGTEDKYTLTKASTMKSITIFKKDVDNGYDDSNF